MKASIREANESLVSTVTKLKRDLTGQLHTTTLSRKRRPSGSSTGHSTKRPRIESLESPSSTSTKSDKKISGSISAQPIISLPVRSPVLARTTPMIPRIPRSVFATPRPKAATPCPAASAVLSRENSTKRLPSLLQRIISSSQKPASHVSPPVFKGSPVPIANSSSFSRTLSKSWLPTFGEPKAQLPNVKIVRPQMLSEDTSQKSKVLPVGSRESTLAPTSVSRLPARSRINARFPPKYEENSTLNPPAGLTLHSTPSLAFKNQVKESAVGPYLVRMYTDSSMCSVMEGGLSLWTMTTMTTMTTKLKRCACTQARLCVELQSLDFLY